MENEFTYSYRHILIYHALSAFYGTNFKKYLKAHSHRTKSEQEANIYCPRTYVRREVMFSQVRVCSTFGGRGYPIPGPGGVPHPWSGGGYPVPGPGGTPSQVWLGGGVHHPRSGWGGYPDLGPPQTWDGVSPGPGMGYPSPTWDRVPPTPSIVRST